jgi:hypothetical protein
MKGPLGEACNAFMTGLMRAASRNPLQATLPDLGIRRSRETRPRRRELLRRYDAQP